MNEKAKFLITGFVIGVVTVWFFTFVSFSARNSNTNFPQMRGAGYNQNSDSFDAHFIEQMIPHHVDAISMSELALERSQKDELRELAQNIITSQSEENEQMKAWYRQWFGSEYVELDEDNFRMGPGMMGGRMGMLNADANIQFLEEAEDFDVAFVREMIPHHQMAIMMASMLKNGTQRKEMKELADNIIKTQSAEINLMREWLQKWEE